MMREERGTDKDRRIWRTKMFKKECMTKEKEKKSCIITFFLGFTVIDNHKFILSYYGVEFIIFFLFKISFFKVK